MRGYRKEMDTADGEPAMTELIRLGLLKPPAQPLPDDLFENEPEVEDPQGEVLRSLLEERENAR